MMRRIPIALLLVLAACAGDGGGSAADSGVEGIVLAGPQCPVNIEGTPCPDQPIDVEILVTDTSSGEQVTTVRSGEDGRFRIPLEPGTYLLRPVPDGYARPPVGAPKTVTVRAGEFAEVTLEVDTGIR